MFKAGDLDVITGFSRTAERADFANYTRPYRDEVISVFGKVGSAKPEDVQTYADIIRLHLHLVAPLAGYFGQGLIDAEKDLVENKALTRTESLAQGLRMIEVGHGELVLGDDMVVQDTQRSLGLAPLQRMQLEANRDKVYFGLSKASTTAADLRSIDEAVGVILSRGLLQKLTTKYGLRELNSPN